MKILYVHHNPGKGGSSNSLRLMLEALVKQADVDILITCPPGPAFERFEKSGFTVIESLIPYIMQTTAGVRFQWIALIRNLIWKRNFDFYERVFNSFKPDIVHFNEIGLFTYAKLAKKMGFKTVLHSRIVPDKKYFFLNNFVQRQINKYVDHLIAIDKSVIHSLNKINVPKSIIYNPFHITEELKNYVPSHFKDEIVNVTFLSNFLLHKGINDVIQAAIILKENPEIRFKIAGANVKSSDFYNSRIGQILDLLRIYPNIEKWIKKKIKDYNLKNIELLGEVNNIVPLLKSTHILLMPNLMNEPSRSVFEGGVFGIPSIISLNDVIEDVVEDGYNGFIVNEKSPKQIAAKIMAYAKNREMMFEMGQKARNRFLNVNNSERSAKGILSIYKSLES